MLHMADLAATYLEERESTEMLDTFWDTVKQFARPAKATEQKDEQPEQNAAQSEPAKQEPPRGVFPGQQ